MINLYLQFIKFAAPCAFPKYVMANSNGNSASPWNILFWILTPFFSSRYEFRSPVFHGFLD